MALRLGLLFAAIGLAAACSVTPTPAKPEASEIVGTLNPAVTQETVDVTVCVSGWTATVRPPSRYTSALERRQIAEQGLPGTPADYEEDHLMPLALGGAPADPNNLRPIPLARARRDDVWERRLHDDVCDGTTQLDDAQLQMSRIKKDL